MFVIKNDNLLFNKNVKYIYAFNIIELNSTFCVKEF